MIASFFRSLIYYIKMCLIVWMLCFMQVVWCVTAAGDTCWQSSCQRPWHRTVHLSSHLHWTVMPGKQFV